MFLPFLILIVYYISSFGLAPIFQYFLGKPDVKDRSNDNDKESFGSYFELTCSVGIIISSFLPWTTYALSRTMTEFYGINSVNRNLMEISWFDILVKQWNEFSFVFTSHDIHFTSRLSFLGLLIFMSSPLIMAIINVVLRFLGKARGWSFYTGIATCLWIAVIMSGTYGGGKGYIIGAGFIIGICCTMSIIVSSLIAILPNPRQHISFILGHFSLITFGIIISLFVILMKMIGIESNIFSFVCFCIALILTLICDYYMYLYLSRTKKDDAINYKQPVPSPVTGNEHAESVLDQHWMYCTKCGTKCKDYLKFCPRCGFGLHPEREEPSHGDSDYAPPRRAVERPEYSSEKETDYARSKPIPFIDNQIRPVVTRAGGVIHVENTVHPTVENSPEPQMKKTPKVVERKIPTLPSAARGNKWGLWVLIAFAVLLVGSIPAYLFWYKPYATDRDAPRYFTFTNLNLRSSKIADVKHNLLELLPYGTELIVYSIDGDWASVKAGNQKGYVASSLILPLSDFELLNSIWGNTDAKECINTSKCRLALLDYYKRFNMSGGTEWQIYTRKKEDRVNTVYYKKLCNRNSKFTDFTFIVKNNRTNERELVIYSFDDETEKPIFRKARRLFPNETGYIKSITSTASWIDILLSDGGWIQVEI